MFNAYFEERLEKLRREPEENLLTELVQVETEDGKLAGRALDVLPAAARRR